jgi:hypothetical protein
VVRRETRQDSRIGWEILTESVQVVCAEQDSYNGGVDGPVPLANPGAGNEEAGGDVDIVSPHQGSIFGK